MSRPLPVGSILKVAGVSHRQEAVRTVKVGDPVSICHDPANGADPNACPITTADGRLLGFVPRAGDLNVRMSTSTPNGCWSGTVDEVLTGESSWGLRVRLGPLVATATPTRPGDGGTGIRGRADLVDDDGTLLPVPGQVPPPAETGDVAGAEADDAVGDAGSERGPRLVYARSNRVLGTFVGHDAGGKVLVRASNGQVVAYPAAVVRIAAA